MLDEWMAQFAKEMGVPELPKPEVPGVYTIPLEEDVTIVVSALPEVGFSLGCAIAECPKERREEFYTHMMRSNLFGQGTKGASLGLDEAGKRVTLTQNVDYETDFEGFMQILEDFMNAVDLWREERDLHVGTKIEEGEG